MRIEIWSDIACPWCYVGIARLDAALAQFAHRDDVEVVWRSFELDASAPPERTGDHAEQLARKYGVDVERARGMLADMTQTGAEAGVELDFARIRPGNTFDGHRIVHLAATRGLQDAMKRRLLKAYLAEGKLMADHATLARLAGEVGLPADEVADTLGSDRFADEVRADEDLALQLGTSGVPFFVADRRFAATGAQSPEVLGRMLDSAWEARTPLEVVTGGETCGPDGC